MKILDVGCGSAHSFATSYPEIDITRCDINPSEGVEVQDMEKMAYPDSSFDVVTCINALDHTKDAEAALNEILRVAKGYVYINCAIDQMTRHRKKHYWDAKPDGRFVNPESEFDLRDYGFDIEFEDGRMIAEVR